LLRAVRRHRLRQVVVLHRNDEDAARLGRLRDREGTGCLIFSYVFRFLLVPVARLQLNTHMKGK
jgi:hypothetical protein